jgi:hypothetical protein
MLFVGIGILYWKRDVRFLLVLIPPSIALQLRFGVQMYQALCIIQVLYKPIL